MINRGWPRATPAAAIFDGSTPRQQVWRGRLDEVVSGELATSDGPGTIVIGAVAAMDVTGFATLNGSRYGSKNLDDRSEHLDDGSENLDKANQGANHVGR